MKTQYITNKKGKINAVIAPKKEYDKMVAVSEELKDIKAFDEVISKIKRGEEQFISLEEVLKSVNK